MIEKQTTMRFKLLLILISAICNSSFGQRIALIDTKFKSPILFTDSVSVNQVSNALLPIRVDEFDTLNAHLEFIKKVLSEPKRSKMQSFELKTQTISISVSRIPMAYADRYIITMQTLNNGINATYNLLRPEVPNKDGIKKIENLRKYIDSNTSLFGPPKAIEPKFYNVVVVSEK
jgi:hypothetical protein